MMNNLNDKQEAFAKYYSTLKSDTYLDLAASYMKAYPDSKLESAYVSGHRLLKNDKIKAYIDKNKAKIHAKLDEKAKISLEYINKEHLRIFQELKDCKSGAVDVGENVTVLREERQIMNDMAKNNGFVIDKVLTAETEPTRLVIHAEEMEGEKDE